MRGYPHHIATAQDYQNLLAMPEYREQAKADLQKIKDTDDAKVTKATTLIDPEDPESGYNTEIIDNPMPLWKKKGFASKTAVAKMITKAKEV
ncbi:MAG: hypothetical protein U9Q87_06795 [Pseudomonadota bacterium]|nr:hypothetical protein [Pseudomonadota bacterium]